ncbi:hypothetical protein BX616_005162 [Lobosporangium transversale]|nr:hypothetical protein BX616_005162 [Lobosporangium transversale]
MHLGIKDEEFSSGHIPSAPPRFGPPTRKLTFQVKQDMTSLMNTLIETVVEKNRQGKALDTSMIQSLIESNLPADYGHLRSNPAVTRSAQAGRPINSGFENAVMRKLDGIQALAIEIFELQRQMNDRLILIDRKTEAILTMNYELLEYTIPRLFIVLPDYTSDTSDWDPANKLRTRFRLHFICECGEHTQVPGNKDPPHYPHLARHEGYIINRPTEFFKKYGPYVLVMLEMLKAGTTFGGCVLPALSSLKIVETLSIAQLGINSINLKTIEGVDYSLAFLEENRTRYRKLGLEDLHTRNLAAESTSRYELAAYLAGVDGAEGVDLRQLSSYLAMNDTGNLYGNLFRVVAENGHVKWVCREHFDTMQEQSCIRKVNEAIKTGVFDVQLGRIEMSLKSAIEALEIYQAIGKIKRLHELDLILQWDQEYLHLVRLKDAISKAKIKAVKLTLLQSSKASDTNIERPNQQLYNPLFEIMQLSSTQSFEINQVPKDFLKQSSPMEVDLPHLKHLSIIGSWAVDRKRRRQDMDKDIEKLKALVKNATKLSSLSLNVSIERLPKVFNALSQYQSCLVNFVNLGLRVLPSMNDECIQNSTTILDLTQLFQLHGAQLETLDLRNLRLEGVVVEAIVKATERVSRLKELYWPNRSQYLDDQYIKNLVTIAVQSD